MALLVMDRKASDNKYLHLDFHSSVDNGLRYVGEHYGEKGVRELLRRYTLAYHKPRLEDIRRRGLTAIAEYLKDIYEKEDASDALRYTLTDACLTVETAYHPGVRYMRSVGETPSEWGPLTMQVVYGIFAEAAGCAFSLRSYEEQTGAAKFSFAKKEAAV
ncbi:MAG: hypothetical protein ACOXZM_07260 [Eubacteriales bacterium]|jgi:hypothetical protein